MRMLIDVTIPVEAGNAAMKDGRLPKTIAAAVEQWRPEATYFYPKHGKRHALWVVEVKDPSQIPPLFERFFEELNAEIEITPVMTLEDLQKGLKQLAGTR